ncbi:MAG TPA: hypothetical protein ENH35_05110 [Candidatus Moranbacteria bacterium]|nr:hypothetical protein [Candidatus Moranbacteria bacterium]
MLYFIDRYFIHKDKRGSLEGLINFGQWREVNLIQSQTNIVRGNHYHKETIELFVILKGKILVRTQKVEDDNLAGPVCENIVQTGHVFMVEPYINHTFHIIKSSKWINILSKKIEKDNPDIHFVGN